MVLRIRGDEAQRRRLGCAVSARFPGLHYDYSSFVGLLIIQSFRLVPDGVLWFIKGYCVGAGLTCEEQD